jgi:uncharacterized RDD family membrane protein YckC
MTDQPTPEGVPPGTTAGQPATMPPESAGAGAASGPLVDWSIPEPRALPGRRQIVYADIPNRVIAYLVDLVAIVIFAVVIAVIFALAFTAGGGLTGRVETGVSFLVNVIVGLVIFAYFVYGWTSRRATIGMRWLGLQIGNAGDGSTLTMEQGIRRFVALFGPSIVYELLTPVVSNSLAAILGLLAFVWLVYLLIDTARSPTKQGFHDRFANTLVVKVTRAPG